MQSYYTWKEHVLVEFPRLPATFGFRGAQKMAPLNLYCTFVMAIPPSWWQTQSQFAFSRGGSAEVPRNVFRRCSFEATSSSSRVLRSSKKVPVDMYCTLKRGNPCKPVANPVTSHFSE